MENNQKIIERDKKFFKGIGKLLDVLGFLGILTSSMLLSAVVFDFAQYMGKYSQINYFDGLSGLLLSLLLIFFGNKIRKYNFYSNWYLIGTFLIIAPAPVFGFVGGIGAILWLIFIIHSVRGFVKIYKLKKGNNYNLVFDHNTPESNDWSSASSGIPVESFEKSKAINYGFHKGIILSTLCGILIFGALFYWYALRPTGIKKECSMVVVTAYSQEEKDVAKKYLDEKCPIIPKGGLVLSGCRLNKEILDAPLVGKESRKGPASDEQYEQCLREKGL
jgi:hypothetical protein